MPRKVAIVGDVILDRTTTVGVRGPSPENSGVLVVTRKGVEHGLGGAANVAAGCLALGAEPYLLGYNDSSLVSGLLVESRIAHYLPDTGSGSTPVKDRIVTADGHPLLRVDKEERWEGGKKHWTGGGLSQMRFRDLVMETREQPVVGVVDYDKGSVCQDAELSIMRTLGLIHDTYRMPLIVDPGRRGDWKRFASPHTIFKANAKQCYSQREFIRTREGRGHTADMPVGVDWTQGQDTPTCVDLVERTRINLKDQGIEFAYLVITLGPSGIVVASRVTSQVVHVAWEHVNAADVCGCGDTVMATLLSFFALQTEKVWEWGTMLNAVSYAQAAAQVAVCRRGVYVVRKEELPGWPTNISLERRPTT